MSNVFFSIVIPTYNRAQLLNRCLESVVSQTYSNWEAIVVDNYSEDNTEDVVRSFGDSRIIFVKNHNYGVISVSRNKALDMSKGDWVCFLDSDDYWFPNKLESVLPYLNDYDLVYHGYRKNIPRTKIFQKINCFFFDIKVPTVSWLIVRGDPINPSCTCVSRKAIGDTRFDESKSLFAVEDYDFFLQLIYKGIRPKRLKKILTCYDVSGCSNDEKAADRDLCLFEKWKSVLNERERKELDLLYYKGKADYFRSNEQFKEAAILYRKALCSHVNMTRLGAIKGIIMCLFRTSFS